MRHTSTKRMRAKLKLLKRLVKQRRHLPIPIQGAWLSRVVQGHLQYYAVPTNIDKVSAFRTDLARHWLKALRRRGQRDRTNWGRMQVLVNRWLPRAKILHPWPDERFDANTRGRSRVR